MCLSRRPRPECRRPARRLFGRLRRIQISRVQDVALPPHRLRPRMFGMQCVAQVRLLEPPRASHHPSGTRDQGTKEHTARTLAALLARTLSPMAPPLVSSPALPCSLTPKLLSGYCRPLLPPCRGPALIPLVASKLSNVDDDDFANFVPPSAAGCLQVHACHLLAVTEAKHAACYACSHLGRRLMSTCLRVPRCSFQAVLSSGSPFLYPCLHCATARTASRPSTSRARAAAHLGSRWRTRTM